MQYQIPQIKRPLDQGATVQQTYLFPPNQPEMAYWRPNRWEDRYGLVVPPRFEGATNVQYTPVQGVVMEYSRQYQFPAPRAPILGTSVVSAQTYLFPVSQPEFSYYEPEVNRYLDKLTKRFEGATTQQTYLFPVSQPDFTYYRRNTFSDVYLPVLGVTVTAAPTYLFPVSQPEFAYYKPEVNRYQDELVKRFEGATNQKTFPIPIVYEPDFRFYLRNTYSQVFRPIEGATVHQQYVYPVNQYEPRYYVKNTFSDIYLQTVNPPAGTLKVTQQSSSQWSYPI